ncbi:hypothetical protein ABRG53_1048 [Pseudanabaena sp. ABRG5-3]|nr:hypothetical protein ABRG53_1048 [Pseudanabaena sp. ABRG5-3]
MEPYGFKAKSGHYKKCNAQTATNSDDLVKSGTRVRIIVKSLLTKVKTTPKSFYKFPEHQNSDY